MFTPRVYRQAIAFCGKSKEYRRQSREHRKKEKEYLNPENNPGFLVDVKCAIRRRYEYNPL